MKAPADRRSRRRRGVGVAGRRVGRCAADGARSGRSRSRIDLRCRRRRDCRRPWAGELACTASRSRRVARDRSPPVLLDATEIAAEVVVEISSSDRLAVSSTLPWISVSSIMLKSPTSSLEPNGAVDAAALEIDEVGAVALEVAADACVAGGQGSAREQRDVASHLGARERAAAYDQQVAVDASMSPISPRQKPPPRGGPPSSCALAS